MYLLQEKMCLLFKEFGFSCSSNAIASTYDFFHQVYDFPMFQKNADYIYLIMQF